MMLFIYTVIIGVEMKVLLASTVIQFNLYAL